MRLRRRRRLSARVWASRRGRERFDDVFERQHVDRVVIRRAAKLSLLRRGRVAERHAQTAADTEVGAHSADEPPVTIGLLDDTARHGARRLTDRARKRAEATVGIDDSNRLRGLLPRPGHHLGPHGYYDYTLLGARCSGLVARGSLLGARGSV